MRVRDWVIQRPRLQACLAMALGPIPPAMLARALGPSSQPWCTSGWGSSRSWELKKMDHQKMCETQIQVRRQRQVQCC